MWRSDPHYALRRAFLHLRFCMLTTRTIENEYLRSTFVISDEQMNAEEWKKTVRQGGVMSGSPIAGWRPQEGPQYALVICPLKDIFFGGTRGGGKADAQSASNQHPASLKRQDCTLVA